MMVHIPAMECRPLVLRRPMVISPSAPVLARSCRASAAIRLISAFASHLSPRWLLRLPVKVAAAARELCPHAPHGKPLPCLQKSLRSPLVDVWSARLSYSELGIMCLAGRFWPI
jgi:hypothetical protein